MVNPDTRNIGEASLSHQNSVSHLTKVLDSLVGHTVIMVAALAPDTVMVADGSTGEELPSACAICNVYGRRVNTFTRKTDELPEKKDKRPRGRARRRREGGRGKRN